MGKIEKLIQQYCPDGVEFRRIKDVYKRIKGTPITATKMKEIANPTGSVRIFAGGKTVIDANEEDIPNANITRVPAVLVQSRGVIDVVYYERPFTFKNEMWAYTTENKTSVKYLYYVMKSNVQTFRDAASGMGALPQISLGTTEDFEIPLPPLPVQEAIVNILDRFAVYAAELQAELQARQQQYNYYRDTLLSFEGREDVQWVTIDLLFHRKNGYTPSKNNNDYWTGGTIPWFRMEDIRANGRVLTDSIQKIHHSAVKKNGLIKAGSIIVATSATIGEHALVKVDCLTNQRFTCLTVKDEYTHRVDTMFLFYYMFKVDEWCKTHTVQGNFPGVDMSQFPNVLIPLPDIDEQRKIASILDRFDRLVNDLSQGLPAEIEARQQQYEYYRDKLLTFKRK